MFSPKSTAAPTTVAMKLIGDRPSEPLVRMRWMIAIWTTPPMIAGNVAPAWFASDAVPGDPASDFSDFGRPDGSHPAGDGRSPEGHSRNNWRQPHGLMRSQG